MCNVGKELIDERLADFNNNSNYNDFILSVTLFVIVMILFQVNDDNFDI